MASNAFQPASKCISFIVSSIVDCKQKDTPTAQYLKQNKNAAIDEAYNLCNGFSH